MKGFAKMLTRRESFVILSRDTRFQNSSANFHKLSMSTQKVGKISSKQHVNPFSLISNNFRSRNVNTLSNGFVAKQPIRYGIVDISKVILTCIAGLTVGAWLSKRMVAILEEYELFVLEEDEDEDDDYD